MVLVTKKRNDYKVIRFVSLNAKLPESLVQVYSVNNGLWTDLTSAPFFLYRLASAFNIGGTPYWEGYDTRFKRCICSFDPAKEVFDYIKYPSEIKATDFYPVNLHNKVSVLVLSENKMIDIYNVENSTWVKKVTTGKLPVQLDLVCNLHCYKICGDVVAWEGLIQKFQ